MKKLVSKLLFILIPSILSSCSFINHSTQSHATLSYSYPNTFTSQPIVDEYEKVAHLKIYWSQIFLMSDDSYYVYLFSSTCFHCNSLKAYIVEAALSNKYKIYFVEESTEVVIDVNKAKQNNVSTLEELGIRGYPTLLTLENKIITSNVAGIDDIQKIIKN